jgi:S-adenosylmethionine:tRNA ribosyltransferase-isomerase
VIPARLLGVKQTEQGSGARIEILLLEEHTKGIWEALLRPGSRMKPGSIVLIDGGIGLSLQVRRKLPEGRYEVEFTPPDIERRLPQMGRIPLPPYIQRLPEPNDNDRYQTVYARQPGSVAAPTAGLHFDTPTLERLRQRGVEIAYVTLHIGMGTFKPVTTEHIEDHPIHSERFSLTAESAAIINHAKAKGNAVVAVGTTAVRVLESCVGDDGWLVAREGRTSLFIYPPYQPKMITSLLTNFHLPKSTLLMLICALASREQIFGAYHQAIAERMRFYSYGDCMLII